MTKTLAEISGEGQKFTAAAPSKLTKPLTTNIGHDDHDICSRTPKQIQFINSIDLGDSNGPSRNILRDMDAIEEKKNDLFDSKSSQREN